MSSATEGCPTDVAVGRTIETTAATATAAAATTDSEWKRVKLSPRDDQLRRTQMQQRRQVVGRGVVASTRKYQGHRDGVWDVDASSIGLSNSHSTNTTLVGTASAGTYTIAPNNSIYYY